MAQSQGLLDSIRRTELLIQNASDSKHLNRERLI